MISHRAFVLSSHSKANSSEGVSMRCRANEHITISIASPLFETEELCGLAFSCGVNRVSVFSVGHSEAEAVTKVPCVLELPSASAKLNPNFCGGASAAWSVRLPNSVSGALAYTFASETRDWPADCLTDGSGTAPSAMFLKDSEEQVSDVRAWKASDVYGSAARMMGRGMSGPIGGTDGVLTGRPGVMRPPGVPDDPIGFTADSVTVLCS